MAGKRPPSFTLEGAGVQKKETGVRELLTTQISFAITCHVPFRCHQVSGCALELGREGPARSMFLLTRGRGAVSSTRAVKLFSAGAVLLPSFACRLALHCSDTQKYTADGRLVALRDSGIGESSEPLTRGRSRAFCRSAFAACPFKNALAQKLAAAVGEQV